MKPGDKIMVEVSGADLRGIIISLHGPVARVNTWDGKRHKTFEVQTAKLKPARGDDE